MYAFLITKVQFCFMKNNTHILIKMNTLSTIVIHLMCWVWSNLDVVITSKVCTIGGVSFLAEGWEIDRSAKSGGGPLKFLKTPVMRPRLFGCTLVSKNQNPRVPSLSPNLNSGRCHLTFPWYRKCLGGLLSRHKVGSKRSFFVTQPLGSSTTCPFLSQWFQRMGDAKIFKGRACCHLI